MKRVRLTKRTGDDIRVLRGSMGVRQHDFAALVGVNLTTVYRWECLGPKAPPTISEQSERVFRRLDELELRHRKLVARALLNDGWRAAWALLFARSW